MPCPLQFILRYLHSVRLRHLLFDFTRHHLNIFRRPLHPSRRPGWRQNLQTFARTPPSLGAAQRAGAADDGVQAFQTACKQVGKVSGRLKKHNPILTAPLIKGTRHAGTENHHNRQHQL
ncbi:hypothetical protein [Neisseria musculi]|uniref:hypothetical protein n=1 Tax=Neisseria musculi TaxID=1815583 RepID=UPI00164CBCF3|nr:hypothetical protein [Neisseria musculi]